MSLKAPKSILCGHETLCEDIETIISISGEIGTKAKILADMLYPHFKREEEYALPPLSLLVDLVEGHWEIDSDIAIKMADKLSKQLAEMKKEHESIFNLLEDLKILAIKENNLKVQRFIKDLILHIEIEDQVLYPATILIGNYLKDKL